MSSVRVTDTQPITRVIECLETPEQGRLRHERYLIQRVLMFAHPEWTVRQIGVRARELQAEGLDLRP